jgi:hypothetical protein
MNILSGSPNEDFPLSIRSGHLLLAITEEKERKGLTELIARLALKGSFYFLAGGEWVPCQDDLRVSIGRHTRDMDAILDNPHLTRPTTCLQLVDLIAGMDGKAEPLLILDLFHLFYNPDIDILHRMRLLRQCSQHLQRIKLSRPVIIFIQQMPHHEYEMFFPIISLIANETVVLGRDALLQTLLPEAFMGRDLPSSRALAEKLRTKMHAVAKVVQPGDRLIINKLGEWILKHSVAIANATDLSPMEAALTLIALEEHKRIDGLFNDVEVWMRELERKIEESIPVNE